MKKTAVIFIFWFIGWVLCGATVMIGRELTSVQNALIIHAILAPIFFAILSFIYFRKFAYTSPIQTATTFTILTIVVDAIFIAPVIEKSYAMFGSFLGTWLVFILIFFSTFIIGALINKQSKNVSDRQNGLTINNR